MWKGTEPCRRQGSCQWGMCVYVRASSQGVKITNGEKKERVDVIVYLRKIIMPNE
jgi:hypothetical protein